MLAGAAAGLDHVTGFAGKELLQHRPDRLMVAVKRRGVETAVGFDRPAVLAEFHDIFRHGILPVWWVAEAYPLCRDRANHENLTDISGPGASHPVRREWVNRASPTALPALPADGV